MANDDCRGVLALSSGFMTYPERIHPACPACERRSRRPHPQSSSCLPSIATYAWPRPLRRQVTRPFGRSGEREAAVIRERYSIYMALSVVKVETMHPVDEVVDEIASALPPNKWLDGRGPLA